MQAFIYGTAWKRHSTQQLVHDAILNGFRAIDTAAQPKHYREDLVGKGIRDAIASCSVTRSDLYIQTKFTAIHGQDPSNLPYDPQASIGEQVDTSVASSLHNLRHTEDNSDAAFIDCLVLHSPYPTPAETREAWNAMESYVPHHVRKLGISNIYHLPTLRQLYNQAQIKPVVVQNRFYRDTGYDSDIRAFCSQNGITYQSFWTLTANPHLLRENSVRALAEQVNVSSVVALYSLVLGIGNVSILNGTTQLVHMNEDLEGQRRVEQWKEHHPEQWQQVLQAFQTHLK